MRSIFGGEMLKQRLEWQFWGKKRILRREAFRVLFFKKICSDWLYFLFSFQGFSFWSFFWVGGQMGVFVGVVQFFLGYLKVNGQFWEFRVVGVRGGMGVRVGMKLSGLFGLEVWDQKGWRVQRCFLFRGGGFGGFRLLFGLYIQLLNQGCRIGRWVFVLGLVFQGFSEIVRLKKSLCQWEQSFRNSNQLMFLNILEVVKC